jgi:SAM-dependent methyltransferase
MGSTPTEGSASTQAELWGQRPDDWAEIQEGQCRALFDDVVQRVLIGAGRRVLDAGCGAGGFCVLALRTGASVYGIDACAPLLEIAKRRAPEANLRVGDLEALPYEDGTFDFVVGINAFQYTASPERALREAKRVCRRRGQVVMATWGGPEDCEAAEYLAALKPLMPPAPTGSGGPFVLSELGVLNALAARVGLVPKELVDVTCTWDYPDVGSAIRGLLSAGPAELAIRHSGWLQVREAVRTALERFAQPNGRYRLRNVFRYLIAEA